MNIKNGPYHGYFSFLRKRWPWHSFVNGRLAGRICPRVYRLEKNRFLPTEWKRREKAFYVLMDLPFSSFMFCRFFFSSKRKHHVDAIDLQLMCNSFGGSTYLHEPMFQWAKLPTDICAYPRFRCTLKKTVGRKPGFLLVYSELTISSYF